MSADDTTLLKLTRRFVASLSTKIVIPVVSGEITETLKTYETHKLHLSAEQSLVSHPRAVVVIWLY